VNKVADKEKKKEEKKEKPAKASPKLAKLIEEIEKLSVIELADLVKALEDKFGVSATPVAAAPAATPTGGEEAKEEKTAGQATFNVVLANAGDNKISVIKVVRELNQTLGLKEAKELVESAPKEVLSGVNKEESEKAKKRLEDAGATVELK
jgi:large subunit ribosomal protein L7/L12